VEFSLAHFKKRLSAGLCHFAIFARRGYMALSIAVNEVQYEGFAAAFEEFWQAYGGLLEES